MKQKAIINETFSLFFLSILPFVLLFLFEKLQFGFNGFFKSVRPGNCRRRKKLETSSKTCLSFLLERISALFR